MKLASVSDSEGNRDTDSVMYRSSPKANMQDCGHNYEQRKPYTFGLNQIMD